MELLKDAVANANGKSHQYAGGMATVYCWGNFAGATIKLLVSPNGSVWFYLEGYTLVQTSKPKNRKNTLSMRPNTSPCFGVSLPSYLLVSAPCLKTLFSWLTLSVPFSTVQYWAFSWLVSTSNMSKPMRFFTVQSSVRLPYFSSTIMRFIFIRPDRKNWVIYGSTLLAHH